MKKHYLLLGVIAGLALLAPGKLVMAQENFEADVEPAFRMENYFPPRPRIVTSEEYRGIQWMESKVLSQLAEGKYDELEKMAQELRTSKEVLSNGNWLLTEFYVAVASYDHNDPGDETIAKLKKWVQARPQSVTAQVALAEGLANYAWTARGTTGAAAVPAAAWEAFHERLEQSRAVLREAKKLPVKDPHWWRVAQRVALGQGWDLATYNGLYKEAVAFEPTYYSYYFAKANFLLDRWYGELGDPEKFAAEAANALGKLKGQAQGDALYARMFWGFDHKHYHEISFDEPSLLSMERIERGMKELARQYPNNAAVYGAWFQLYYRTQNAAYKERAKQLLPKTRNIVDPWVWHNFEEYYPAVIWATRS